MALNVPVRVHIAGVVLLYAGRLDLFEPPLRQVDVASTKIAAEILVLETEGSGERAEPRVIPRSSVADYFNLPVILGVSNSCVAVARNLPGAATWCE
jgi:hypothetical protein